jgi:dienelactone hydrolase
MVRLGAPLGAALAVLALGACGGSSKARSGAVQPATSTATVTKAVTPAQTAPQAARPIPKPHPPFAVGMREITFTDRSRMVTVPGKGAVPRALVTLIRYPATGPPSGVDVRGAPPVRGTKFPLLVFGHGFAVTPAIYSKLLQAWARAGYVVAAPIFPLENANAPGGPDESDLVNQPGDVSFVITRLLALSRAPTGFFAGLIDPREIAVSGQSDGGETALAISYNLYYLDRRVRATVILSGAKIPGVSGFDFPIPAPPLLATQGTADTVNPPSFTSAFYDVAPRPKYLLKMFGAAHLGPYTDEEPQLGIVERVTIAFLDLYVKGAAGARSGMFSAGDVPGVSAVQGSG